MGYLPESNNTNQYNMTTQEYLTHRKADGRSQIAFCAFTRQNAPEDTAELQQLESMLKNGDVHIVRDVEFGRKNALFSYRLYRINETSTQTKTNNEQNNKP